MKNSFFKSSALTAAFALIATSCMAEADYDTLKKVDITAEAEALSLDTKTSLTDDLTCVWSGGERIAVYDGTGIREFSATSVSGSSAVFSGEMNTASGTFCVAYPYGQASACSGGLWTVEIPAEQTVAAGGSTAEGALVAVGSSTDATHATFHQVTGLVRFELTQSDIVSVELSGNGGEHLAGSLAVAATDGTIDSFQIPSDKVTLTHASGAFPAGVYYFAVAPVTFAEGLTLVLTSNTGAVSVKASTSPATVARAGGINLGEVSPTSGSGTEIADGCVNVVFRGKSATVTIASDIAQYVTPTVDGAHVSIAQSSELTNELIDAGTASEITYNLSGTSSDGEFYLSGSSKATIELNGLTLANVNPVFSGSAVHIQNGKRIKVKVVTGTTNTLKDAASGSQKGCLYIKGHAEFAQKGTLNIVGNLKHGIKTGEYFTIKNANINIQSAVGDGINCTQYFQMTSGSISIGGTADDGVQCDIDDTTTGSTGETDGHDDEDSGNIYLEGGTINVSVTADAAKCIKAEGDIRASGTTVTATTSGGGLWDSSKSKTKSSSCISADGNMAISGGTLLLTSTGAGGKGISVDGDLAISGGNTTVSTSGNAVVASSSGVISVVTQSSQLDKYDSDYKSSPKGIKVDGAIIISDGAVINITTTGAGGEGIESKTNITVSGGHTTINASDDAINASYNDDTRSLAGAGDFTITGGYLYAHSSGNDGIDANGNCYIKGGLVYAIGASAPEKSIDANTEEQKKLYITGGTIVAVGDFEKGPSITGGTCKYASSWTESSWHALYNGGELVLAFKTPTKSSSQGGPGGPGGPGGSGSQALLVYTSSTPTLKSGVTVSGGTTYFGGEGNIGCTVSGGSNVTLKNYSGGSSGPGGW